MTMVAMGGDEQAWAEMLAEPWGSHANKAADLLGIWEWHGERDSSGMPCRWRLHYTCVKGDCQTRDWPHSWSQDWSAQVDDECPQCGQTYTPERADDLLEDRAICPVYLEDPDEREPDRLLPEEHQAGDPEPPAADGLPARGLRVDHDVSGG